MERHVEVLTGTAEITGSGGARAQGDAGSVCGLRPWPGPILNFAYVENFCSNSENLQT
jgi:hypothetical protein